MIKLSGSRFTDIMPENLAEQTEIQALAYAVGRQVEKLLAYADGARTYAAIYAVPEKVLDLLAVELRTPYYDENFSLPTKRALIQETILFYTQMGTPAATEKIVSSIFGRGYIKEWFEYNGEPHHFRVIVENMEAVEKLLGEFLNVLRAVKRLSSWLDSVTVLQRHEHHLYTGFAVRVGRNVSVGCEIPAELNVDHLVDEDGNLLIDENGARFIDTPEVVTYLTDEEEKHLTDEKEAKFIE